jgi:hypothetical protein
MEKLEDKANISYIKTLGSKTSPLSSFVKENASAIAPLPCGEGLGER